MFFECLDNLCFCKSCLFHRDNLKLCFFVQFKVVCDLGTLTPPVSVYYALCWFFVNFGGQSSTEYTIKDFFDYFSIALTTI